MSAALLLFAAAIALPALLILSTPRGWRVAVIAIWTIGGPVVVATGLAWEKSGDPDRMGRDVLRLLMIFGLPWLIACTLGFSAGLRMRGLLGRIMPAAAPPEEEEEAPSAALVPVVRESTILGILRHDRGPEGVRLLDDTTGALLADLSGWLRSRLLPQPDGGVFLHLSVNATDSLYRLDLEDRTFRDLGEDGPDRPWEELAAAIEEDRALALGPWPRMRRLSPDGTIRVEFEAVEMGNTLWAYSPRVIDLVSGRVVLDLRGTDWDATADFPGEHRVALGLRRFRGGRSFAAELDLRQGTWRILSGDGYVGPQPEQPLAKITRGLELASRQA
ncbi:hypothetical protein EJV46_07885 [Roseococcus sp. SYP-B2431]|uniref:hypothetical protein n=1 Tax=Roseococcus sp. SYP-B2431 TaxID=2496640 RepID=UPI00103B7239|nr:hypothetical protein [Roseococcus sp. SYP-B2431]TCH99217.1 hypothetical protein EJV46_07885 [Roseococcus sp. SYP-B2431]